jgi:hypothetical protein
MNKKGTFRLILSNSNNTFCVQEEKKIGEKKEKNGYVSNHLKFLFALFTLFTFSLNLNAQSQSTIAKLEKLEKILKTASTLNDFKSLLDGDGISAICSLLGGAGVVCEVLSVTELNEGNDEAMAKIKSKYEFDKLLKSKGYNPDDFYRELWLKKNSETIEDRFNFLKQ